MKGKLPQTSSIFAASQDDISDVIVPWVQIQNRQHLMMRFPHCVGNMTTWRHKVNGKSKPVSQMMSLRIFKNNIFWTIQKLILLYEWNIFSSCTLWQLWVNLHVMEGSEKSPQEAIFSNKKPFLRWKDHFKFKRSLTFS